jgi:hypothetical protein
VTPKKSEPVNWWWFRMHDDFMQSMIVQEMDDFDFRVLSACYCMASRSPSSDRLAGAITQDPGGAPVSDKYIAHEAGKHTEVERVTESINNHINIGILSRRKKDDALIVNYKWTQYPSDNSTPRSRKHRDKKRAEEEAKGEAQVPEEAVASSIPKDRTGEDSATLHETLQGSGDVYLESGTDPVIGTEEIPW